MQRKQFITKKKFENSRYQSANFTIEALNNLWGCTWGVVLY